MKRPLILLALALASHAARAVEPFVIYGADDRKEAYQATTTANKLNAQSTVALMPGSVLRASGGRYSFLSPTVGSAFGLCSSERFVRQPAAAYCSGVLIASDTVLTAGHCLRSVDACRGTAFVFDFRMEKGRSSVSVPVNSVYACRRLQWTQTDGGGDFAVVKLDRPVTDRPPAPIRTGPSPKRGASMTLFGHPLGMPLKWASNGLVRSREGVYITASMDAYAGNSGSPVFSSRTGRLEGVLSRGEEDFVRRGSCYVSKRCSQSGCVGEYFTDIQAVMSRLLHSF